MSRQLLAILALALILGVGVFSVLNRSQVNELKQKENQEIIQGKIAHSQETATEIIKRNLDGSGWEHYRDQAHRVEFKYPKEMFEIFTQAENVANSDVVTDTISLFLYFKLPGNTVRTPILSFVFNQPVKPELINRYGLCEEVIVNSKKFKLCSTKDQLSNDLQQFNSYAKQGTCTVRDNQGGSLYMEMASKISNGQEYNDLFVIDLDCNHNALLGQIYKGIFDSIKVY